MWRIRLGLKAGVQTHNSPVGAAVPALVFGRVVGNHAALQNDAALGFVQSKTIAFGAWRGVTPNAFQRPTPLIAANAGVLKADVDVFVSAHERCPFFGCTPIKKTIFGCDDKAGDLF